MRCTCCLFMLTLWSAAAGCNNRMPMCIGSFSLHSKWIGLSKRYPNSSVLRRDVESDRLIGNNPFSLPTRHILKLGQDRFFIAFWCSRYPFIVTFWREGSSVVLNRKPLASVCRRDIVIDCVMLLWQAIVFCVSRDRLRHAMGWGVSFSMWS